MSPFERIEAAYAANPKEEPFLNYLVWYHRHGFVFSRPDFFVMARPVIRSASHADILAPTHLFPSEECDCWYVMAAAGNMAAMWKVLPWPLGWICWTRIDDPLSELRFSTTENLVRLSPPDLNKLPSCLLTT